MRRIQLATSLELSSQIRTQSSRDRISNLANIRRGNKHENTFHRRLRVWRDSLRVRRRANHDAEMPLSRLPTSNRERIRCGNCGPAGGLSVNARTIALPFYVQHQTREAQAWLLCRMRIATYRSGIRSRGFTICWNSCREPRRPELVSTSDGHFYFGRATVGSNGS